MELQEWNIHFSVTRRNSDEAVARFTYNGELLGEIKVDPQTHGTADMAFAHLMRFPHRWSPLPEDLHTALLTYRRETLADVDYRDKAYRFLPIGERHDVTWKLTTDKSDIRIPKEPENVA